MTSNTSACILLSIAVVSLLLCMDAALATSSSYCRYRGLEIISIDGEETATVDCIDPNNGVPRCENVTCICPDDFVGDRCEAIRGYQCTIGIVEPELECVLPDIEHSALFIGVPSCIRRNITDSVDFVVKISCHFSAPVKSYANINNRTLLDEVQANITATSYALRVFSNESDGGETIFAVSDTHLSEFEGKTLLLRPINYNRLSDQLGDISSAPLAIEQFGIDVVSFPAVDLSVLEQQRYVVADRLYFEFIFDGFSSAISGVEYQHLDVAVDIGDGSSSLPRSNGSEFPTIPVILITALIGLVSYVAVRKVRRRKREREMAVYLDSVEELG